MVPRTLQAKLRSLARKYPIVKVTGPRQSGKTTLCRATFPRKRWVSFEDLDVREYATRDPRGFLADHASGAIFDEVQRVPGILSYLQTDTDERPVAGRFVLTGSANLQLMESVSQSLAGRTALLQLLPLSYDEELRFPNHRTDLFEVLLWGGYPAPFDREIGPEDWFPSYVATGSRPSTRMRTSGS